MSTLALRGLVGREMAALFGEQLASLTPSDAPLTLDLKEAEIDDARVVAALIEAIRNAALRTGSLQLLEPPQVLAHGLYRVGALGPGSALHVVAPREDIPAPP